MANSVDADIRLDRLLSLLALGTRSQVRDMVKAGRVALNGQAVLAADARAHSGDILSVDGAVVDARTRRHILLNKPCGVLTAARDKKQKTVFDLLPPVYAACGCMPVGRLDKDTEGLLLFTTDGTLSHLLLSPKRHVWKCYLATVDGPLNESDVDAFAQGIRLSDFTAQPARLEIESSSPARAVAQVWVHEGKFHQVRRMFAARGREVTALKRLTFGPLALEETLAPGDFRDLRADELEALKRSVTGENDYDC